MSPYGPNPALPHRPKSMAAFEDQPPIHHADAAFRAGRIGVVHAALLDR
jgi:hypothetical protein